MTQTRSDSGNSAFSETPSDAGAGGVEETQTTGSVIDTINNSDFWADLQATLTAIIGNGEGRQIVVNAQSGVVFARGMPEELRAIGDYLERIHGAAKRQVVLEAKIIEVTLSDGFQAGVNWAAVQQQADGDVIAGGNLSGGGQLGSTPPLAPPLAANRCRSGPATPPRDSRSETLGAAFALAFDIGDFNAFVELLETQGETRVLSSPRVATLNNQKAVIKAGTDEFFVTDVRSNTVTGTASTTSRDVTLTPFFSGIALDVTPQISADGEVTLHIHPTVSDVTDQIEGAHDLGRDRHAAARVQRDPRGRQHRESEERPDHRDRRPDAQRVEQRRFRDSRGRPSAGPAAPVRQHARSRDGDRARHPAAADRRRRGRGLAEDHGARRGSPDGARGRQRRLTPVATEARKRVRLGDLLLEKKLISEQQLKEALDEQRTSGRKLGRVLVDIGAVSEADLHSCLATALNIPFVDLAHIALDHEDRDEAARDARAPASRARPQGGRARLPRRAWPIRRTCSLPTSSRASCSKPIRLALAKEAALLKTIDLIYRRTDEIVSLAEELDEELKQTDVDLGALSAEEGSPDAPVIKLIQSMFQDAVHVNASDIHIEPDERCLRIRLRVDGLLQEQIIDGNRVAAALVTRLKLMCGLDIAEKRKPQDGRFSIKVDDKLLDVRLATMPIYHGEAIVLRLLDQSSSHKTFAELGMPADIAERFTALIERSAGMVLVTGPHRQR